MLKAVDQSQHTDPADQSEHNEQSVTDRLGIEELQQ